MPDDTVTKFHRERVRLRHRVTKAIIHAGDFVARHGPRGEEVWRMDSWELSERGDSATVRAIKFGREHEGSKLFHFAEFNLEIFIP